MAANKLLDDGGTQPNKDVPMPVMVRPPHPPIHHTVIDSVLRDNNSAVVTNGIQGCTVWFMKGRLAYLYFYFQLFLLNTVHVIVATTENVRREGQLELCGNSAAHTCTAACDAASGISLHVVHVCVNYGDKD